VPANTGEEAEFEFEVTAEVEAPPREATKHTVDTDTIRRMPGTRGDALRAITTDDPQGLQGSIYIERDHRVSSARYRAHESR
jgi:hypothetical protein